MKNGSSVDHTTMRAMNTALILNTLHQHAPLSRAGIAQHTGLNKASVSSMIRELIASGMVEEVGTISKTSDIGRPGINLRLNSEVGYIISAEIGADFISVVAVNFALEVVTRRYINVPDDPDYDTMMDYLIANLRDVHGQVRRQDKPILAIALGVPGMVDMQAGRLLFAPNLGWRDLPLKQIIQRHFDVPVFLANEANMAALGESYLGTAPDSRLLLYVSSGIGLGGGIVINGQLLTGINGFAGEFGHMTVARNGLPCRCGNVGCWETEATQLALFRRIREALSDGRDSILRQTNPNGVLTTEDVVYAAENGDTIAQTALVDTGHWIGVGIANLIKALNPEHVVFGGKMALAHDFLMPAIREAITKNTFAWMQEHTHLSIATHIEDACVMGGAAMVHRQIVNNPNGWLTSTEG
ncbi:MAG: ROK family transcriptional regulator [Anaerolineaceae bacterium]|nr:MAG: ROK family transcriptional regulator [Anaerolineaceae bacterium]